MSRLKLIAFLAVSFPPTSRGGSNLVDLTMIGRGSKFLE
jgi:hypothetical protein